MINIKGAPHWNEANRYYRQDNNPTEQMLRKKGIKSLETCGPTSAVMCLDALGVPLVITTLGGYKPQPEEVLTDYFNDPVNYARLEAVRSDVKAAKLPGNEVPQWYPLAVKEVFNAKCVFQWTKAFDTIAKYLELGYAVQLCLKRPGHFIAAVAYDLREGEIIYHDPWPGRLGRSGFGLRMDKAEYDRNVQPYAILYSGLMPERG